MKAKDILGELSDSVFGFLEIDSGVEAKDALNACTKYLEVTRTLTLSKYNLADLKYLERHVKLAVIAEALLNRALLEEQEKNETIARIQNLLG